MLQGGPGALNYVVRMGGVGGWGGEEEGEASNCSPLFFWYSPLTLQCPPSPSSAFLNTPLQQGGHL